MIRRADPGPESSSPLLEAWIQVLRLQWRISRLERELERLLTQEDLALRAFHRWCEIVEGRTRCMGEPQP
jgi:hypothetical protein